MTTAERESMTPSGLHIPGRAELIDAVQGLTEVQGRFALYWLAASGWEHPDGQALMRAIDAAKANRPHPAASHGENHVDNAGHVVSAISPGDCISCGGHVGADGVFHAAQVSA